MSDETLATCKRALVSPYTVDSLAVSLDLEPFDSSQPYQHQKSLVRNCVALPHDLRDDQKKMQTVPCDECTYGFQHRAPFNSLMCRPSPFANSAGNSERCQSCLFSPQNPTTVVDCAVCMDAKPNSAGICQCIM